MQGQGGPMHPGGPPPDQMDHMNQMRHGYKPMPPRGNMGGPMGAGYPQQRFISGNYSAVLFLKKKTFTYIDKFFFSFK